MLAAKVQAVGKAVDLERDAFLDRDVIDAFEVDGVLRPAVDVPARRMAEAAHVRVAQGLLDALRQLPPRHALAPVDACLYPVEPSEDVVGKVELPVGEDVALDPAQDAKRRQQFVRGRDLLGLAPDVVGSEAADGAHGGRVVADRQVVIAALLSGATHLLDARPPVRPSRVAVEVAADLSRLDENGRLAAEGLLAELRRAPGDTERAVDGLLIGCVG